MEVTSCLCLPETEGHNIGGPNGEPGMGERIGCLKVTYPSYWVRMHRHLSGATTNSDEVRLPHGHTTKGRAEKEAT